MKFNVINLIKSDLYRYGADVSLKAFLFHFLYNPGFIYSFWFRVAQSDILSIKILGCVFLKLKQWKYGIHISPRVKVGYGLYLGHGMSIIVNPTATIGNNVNLSQFTTIGSNSGPAAEIGNNVYVGPNCCIVGNIHVGSDVTIGAGSIVTKSVNSNTTVAGSPAREIGQSKPEYIHNKFFWE